MLALLLCWSPQVHTFLSPFSFMSVSPLHDSFLYRFSVGIFVDIVTSELLA